MEPKNNSILNNTTIVVAIITLCGTVATAVLASPALAELVRGTRGTQTAAAAIASSTPLPETQPPPATETAFFTETPTFAPPTSTSTPEAGSTPLPPLPDLITVAISNPTCVTDQAGTMGKFVRHVITIRNLGPGSTAPYGAFSTRVVILSGGQRFTLEQWSTLFNGLVDTPMLDVPQLGPNEDADLTLNLYLRNGNRYGLEVITDSGTLVIPETNTANNSLAQNFNSNCR